MAMRVKPEKLAGILENSRPLGEQSMPVQPPVAQFYQGHRDIPPNLLVRLDQGS
jgi:hypothetical protein